MISLRAQTDLSALEARASFTGPRLTITLLRFVPVATLLFRLAEAGGDPGVFCYRMGVDILSAGGLRVPPPANLLANLAKCAAGEASATSKRIQAACSNLFSTFSTRFSTLKD